MASPSQNRTPRLYHAVAVGPAIAIFAAAVATFLSVGLTLGGGVLALVAAQVVGLGGTTAGATRWLTGGWGALGFVAPPPRAVVGAILIGASFWYINLRLSLPVAHWIGGEQELTAFGARWLADRSVVELIATLAVVPGVCEELACRGLLARALAARYPRWVAVVASATAFSLLHLSLPRAVPTFALGLVLAWLVLVSGSVWPAIVAHVLNNAIAIAMATGAVAPVAAAIGENGDLALGIAMALCGFGGFVAVPRNVIDET